MAKKTNLGSAKRFGPRYGRRNKEKLAVLEIQHRGRHKCPFCNYIKLKRFSVGIWQCEKCNAKFAGKAYSSEISKKSTEALKEDSGVLKEVEEQPEEREKEFSSSERYKEKSKKSAETVELSDSEDDSDADFSDNSSEELEEESDSFGEEFSDDSVEDTEESKQTGAA